ncbi:MAG: ABC transporter permease, partial [Blastocatellia bacterium]|nr:ABC transporter permease [Blastocatellia bacterium]
MAGLRVFIQRLCGLFFKRRLERDLEDEIRAHLEMQIEENLRLGMNPEEARRAARRKFGGVEQVKEAYRDRRGLPLVESTLQDLRYAARSLARNPGYTSIAIITLALGIGANTAIFSAVSAALLRPLPYPEPDKLVTVWERLIKENGRNLVSDADFYDWRERNRVFDNIAAQVGITFDLTEGSEPERINGSRVSSSYFDVLGIKPMLGRSFRPEEELSWAANVVVINHNLWQSRFGADRRVIGRTISLSGESYEVIGVLPPSFPFPAE